MKNIRVLFLPLLVAILAGCASLSQSWIPPEGKTLSDYNDDYADCRIEWLELTTDSDTPYIVPEPGDFNSPLGFMLANAHMDPDFARECMEKKGWVKKEK